MTARFLTDRARTFLAAIANESSDGCFAISKKTAGVAVATEDGIASTPYLVRGAGKRDVISAMRKLGFLAPIPWNELGIRGLSQYGSEIEWFALTESGARVAIDCATISKEAA